MSQKNGRRVVMRARRYFSSVSCAVLLAASVAWPGLLAQALPQSAPPSIAVVAPDTVGFSSEALDKIDEGMQALVDKQHLAGVVTLVARHGRVVQHKAYGVQDLEQRTPMRLDTIARIYSMTKPVTGAAMMMLYEEGKWWLHLRSLRQHAGGQALSGRQSAGRPIPRSLHRPHGRATAALPAGAAMGL